MLTSGCRRGYVSTQSFSGQLGHLITQEGVLGATETLNAKEIRDANIIPVVGNIELTMKNGTNSVTLNDLAIGTSRIFDVTMKQRRNFQRKAYIPCWRQWGF
jgi:hypothetical protein